MRIAVLSDRTMVIVEDDRMIGDTVEGLDIVKILPMLEIA